MFYPPSELPIPVFHSQNRGRLRSLQINKKLFVERQPEIPAGRIQKAKPLFLVCRYFFDSFCIQLCNQIIFLRHNSALPFPAKRISGYLSVFASSYAISSTSPFCCLLFCGLFFPFACQKTNHFICLYRFLHLINQTNFCHGNSGYG